MKLQDGHYYKFSTRHEYPNEVVRFVANAKVGERWSGMYGRGVFVQLKWPLDVALRDGHFYGRDASVTPMTEAEALAYILTGELI